MAAANRKSRRLRIPYMDTKQNVIRGNPAAANGFRLFGVQTSG
jgi:hypothetical protein